MPFPKLRFQHDPEESLHGTDHLALATDADGFVSQMHFAETKVHTGPGNLAVVDAHDQLRESSGHRFGDTLEFLLQHLKRENSPVYEAVLQYLGSTHSAELGTYGIYLIQDEAAYSEQSLNNLEEEDVLLAPLRVRAVRIAELGELIERAWSGIDEALASA